MESSVPRLHPNLITPLEDVLCKLTLEPSTSISSIQSVVDCLRLMSVTKHASNKLRNLNYDKIIILIVSFLPTTFNDDILFKFPPLSPSNPSST